MNTGKLGYFPQIVFSSFLCAVSAKFFWRAGDVTEGNGGVFHSGHFLRAFF
jgi:hypothetical protein